MTTVDSNERKDLQLAILDEVSSFCNSRGLRWFLAFGSLLGAVRHKGFIPWDDDLDIMMPRPDYDRFVRGFRSERLPYVQVVSPETNSAYGLPFAKAHDARTIVREYRYRPDVFGVYVDVFPLDGFESPRRARTMLRLGKLLNAKKACLSRLRSPVKSLSILVAKIALAPLSVRSILREMDRISRRVPFDASGTSSVLCATIADRIRFPRTSFESFVEEAFEGRKCRIPSGADTILRQCYGDYMKLPPEEQRKSHHDSDAFWNR